MIAAPPPTGAFVSLGVPNFRRYFVGQCVSLCGTWMQVVALGWLVLDLTGKGTSLGLVTACYFLPVTLCGPLGGLAADRFPRRRILLVINMFGAAVTIVLVVVVALGITRLWIVYAVALATGLYNLFDSPSRHAFVRDTVGPELLGNAQSLQSLLMGLSMIIGPAIAGIIVARVGVNACFSLNALSFLAVVAALLRIDPTTLEPAAPTTADLPSMRQVAGEVRRTPELLWPLVFVAVLGIFTYEFQITLPLMARQAFEGGAGSYGLLMAAMAGGASVGAIHFARRGPKSGKTLPRLGLVFGAAILLVAAAPTLGMAVLVLPVVGVGQLGISSMTNVRLQHASPGRSVGRVLALANMAFQGSTPLGGPLIGWIGDVAGARWALTVSGVVALLMSTLLYARLVHVAPSVITRRRMTSSPADGIDPLPAA